MCGARSFAVKTAEELLDAEFLAKWEDRQALDPVAWTVLETILRRFVDESNPVRVEELAALLGGQPLRQLSEAIAQLDEKDLILVQEGRVLLAYPFAGMPTPFKVMLPEGRERYAVCAIDALGIPAMLGEPVMIRSRCHHCGDVLEITVAPDGPAGGEGIFVWVGERGDIREKGCSSL